MVWILILRCVFFALWTQKKTSCISVCPQGSFLRQWSQLRQRQQGKEKSSSSCVSVNPSSVSPGNQKSSETSKRRALQVNKWKDLKHQTSEEWITRRRQTASLQAIHSLPGFIHLWISSAFRSPEVPGQPCQWSAQSLLPPVGQWRLRLCLVAPEEKKGGWCRTISITGATAFGSPSQLELAPRR